MRIEASLEAVAKRRGFRNLAEFRRLVRPLTRSHADRRAFIRWAAGERTKAGLLRLIAREGAIGSGGITRALGPVAWPAPGIETLPMARFGAVPSRRNRDDDRIVG